VGIRGFSCALRRQLFKPAKKTHAQAPEVKAGREASQQAAPEPTRQSNAKRPKKLHAHGKVLKAEDQKAVFQKKSKRNAKWF